MGYLVTPVLFSHLGNPQLAGQVAGELFTVVSWLGLGGAVFLSIIYSFLSREKWRFIVLFLMSLFIAINLFYLTPEIVGLRDMAGGAIVKGSEIHTRFALLHGIASGLYLLVSLLGMLLVIRQPEACRRDRVSIQES